MAQLPNDNNNNNKNKNKNNNNNNNNYGNPPSKIVHTTSSFLGRQSNRSANNDDEDIDSMAVGINNTSRGAPIMPNISNMQYADSIGNVQGIGGNMVSAFQGTFARKQMNPQRSLPKSRIDGDMGGKQVSGSFVLAASPGSKVSDTVSFMAPQSKVVGSKLSGEGAGAGLISDKAQNFEVQLITNEMNDMKLDDKQLNTLNPSNTNALNSNIEAKENYMEPYDFYANNTDDTPLIFNSDWHMSDSPHSPLSPDQLKEAAVLELNKLVDEKFVDWDYGSRYVIVGRVYKSPEDAQFRVSIYQTEDDATAPESTILEVRRNGGDAFLFNEFKGKLLNALIDARAIECDVIPPYTMEHGFLADSDMTELPPLGDDTDTDDMITPISSVSNTTLDSEFNAKNCVAEATDTKQLRDFYRENVVALHAASEDDTKLAEIAAVDQVVTKLLRPISGTEQLYDTFVIKLLLEVIYKLIERDSSLVSEDNKNAIEEINNQWKSLITHPYSEEIAGFFPSQQIQWISNMCMIKLDQMNGNN